MTFTEDILDVMVLLRNIDDVGYYLNVFLNKAGQTGHVVTGVIECVHVLQSSPEEVGLCILIETDDVTAQIHHKLVEAFCWENDIAVLKISSYKGTVDYQIDDALGCLLVRCSTSDTDTNDYHNLRADHHLSICPPK